MGRSEAGLTAACTVKQKMAGKWCLVACLVAATVATRAAADKPAEDVKDAEVNSVIQQSNIQELEQIRLQREALRGKKRERKAGKRSNKKKNKNGRKAGKRRNNKNNNKGRKAGKRSKKRKAAKRSKNRKAGKRSKKRKAAKRGKNRKAGKRSKKRKTGKRSKKRKNKGRKAGKRSKKGKKPKLERKIEKGRRKKNQQRSRQTTAKVNLTCLKDAVTFTKFLKDNVVNFLRRNTRLTAQNSLTNKKATKKGEYKEPAARLIQAGLGDKSNLSCSGSTTSIGAKKMKTVTDILDGCEMGIKKACKPPDSINTTTLDKCKTNAIAFNTTVNKCILMATQGKDACSCFQDPEVLKEKKVLEKCKGKNEAKAAAKARTA